MIFFFSIMIIYITHFSIHDFPGGSDDKASYYNVGDLGSIPGSGRSPGKGSGQPTPAFLPGKSHGQRSLVGYSSWGCQELDTIELHFHFLSLAFSYWFIISFKSRNYYCYSIFSLSHISHSNYLVVLIVDLRIWQNDNLPTLFWGG